MIKIKHKGSFNHAEIFFNRMLNRDYLNILSSYGEMGLQILRDMTPKNTGETAYAWNYLIEDDGEVVTLSFINNSENEGANIVLMLMYGHATNNGGYVQAKDFVHPNIIPLFEQLADNAWREVTR